jgi:hypothetical protein
MVRLFTRNGFEWTERCPAIAVAAAHQKAPDKLVRGARLLARHAAVSCHGATSVSRASLF